MNSALEEQILSNHARLRARGLNPLPDWAVHYICKALHFTDNVFLLPMRTVTDCFVLSPDGQSVRHLTHDDNETRLHGGDVVGDLVAIQSVTSYLPHFHADPSSPNNLFISTTSRHIGVGGMDTGDSGTINRLIFAPFSWEWRPANRVPGSDQLAVPYRGGDEGPGYLVAFRYGMQVLDTVPEHEVLHG